MAGFILLTMGNACNITKTCLQKVRRNGKKFSRFNVDFHVIKFASAYILLVIVLKYGCVKYIF